MFRPDWAVDEDVFISSFFAAKTVALTETTECSSFFLLLAQHLPPFHDHGMKLLQPFLKPLTNDCASGLEVPRCRQTKLAQSEHGLHFRQRQRVPQVLLVSHHQHRHPLVLCKPRDFVQFCLGFLDTFRINWIYDKNNPIGTSRVGPPQRTELLLPANVPEVERSCASFISEWDFNFLCIEAFSWNCVHKLIET